MTPAEAVLAVLETIESAATDYVIVGALAYGAYGIPRSTNDADFVLAASGSDLDNMLRKLPPQLSVDPQARIELFTGTRRWILHVADSVFEIELFLLGNDLHHRAIFKRKRRERVPLIVRDAWLPTAEDLIIQKLRWARLKDLDDVRNIIAVQGNALDFAYVDSWCARHGTRPRLAEIRATLPPDL